MMKIGINEIMKRMAVALSLLLSVTACQDESFTAAPSANDQILSATRSTSVASALEQTPEGYWEAHKCVPLVGKGRVIDNFSNGLVQVAGASGGGLGKMLDTDLENPADFGGGLVNAELLADQLVSVRDMDRVYAGGQKAGFVCQLNDSKLLTLDVLKNFWLKTYLNGKLQETQEGSAEGSLLGLDLVSFSTGNIPQITIAAQFEKPFDEIKLGMAGVNADLISVFSIYYAFVGENEEKAVYIGSPHFSEKAPEIHKGVDWTNAAFLNSNLNKLLDADLSNGFVTDLLSELFSAVYITINMNKTVPAGSEIGFYMSSGSLLDIGLFSGVKLTTFDEKGEQMEEATTMSVANVKLASGGMRKVSMVTTMPCSQVKINLVGVNIKLGVTTIHYAYVKDPVKADPSSVFSLKDVTITGNAYTLSAPKDGNTKWTIKSYPKHPTDPTKPQPQVVGNKITGMTVDGDYVISGTFTDNSGNSIMQEMTITRKTGEAVSEACNQVIGTAFGATTYMPEGGGSLITLENIEDVENLVDDDTDNYATYINGLSIAANTPIIGIKTTRPLNTEEAGHKVNTGFVLRTSGGLLGLDLLKFFCIKLYKDGVKVLDKPVDDSNVANVGLIGNKGNKIRIGVTADVAFDQIELWTAGVLDLHLKTYQIYHAYWEDADAGCASSSPNEACIELLTPASHGAAINYEETKMGGLVGAGGSFNELGNLLDSDIESAALVTNGAQVAGTTTVAVKFDEIVDEKKSTQIGFILKQPTGLAGVDLLGATVLKIYHGGVEVGKTGEGGVLGLDLVGYAGRYFVETTAVTTAFDEVRISFSGGVSALETLELSGVFVRRDSDGDGIPDCAEDEENIDEPSAPIINASANPEDVCKPHSITIDVQGGEEGAIYTLQCNDVVSGSQVEAKCTLQGKQLVLPTEAMQAGDWYIGIYSPEGKIMYNGVHVALHALETTWRTDAANTDWHNWNNWTDGVPWGCTQVIIPSNCANYPVLREEDENHCSYIHFCAGAEVVHTQYLTYDQAWVEMSLSAGRYYMLSAPLKDMVTGDMFIPAMSEGDHSTFNKFVALNAANCRESRFTPVVYQRLWSRDAQGQTVDGSVTVTPDATNWTRPFNALAQSYTAGMGFSLKAGTKEMGAGADEETAGWGRLYTFRFPKIHGTYSYVTGSGAATGKQEKISRSNHVGRFIYEDAEGNAPAYPYYVNVTNQHAGQTLLAGNPFMAHIDVRRFLAGNPAITSVKVDEGEEGTYRTYMLVDGQLTGGNGNTAYIAPMQAFFVTVADKITGVRLTYTENMMVQKAGINLAWRAPRRSARSLPAKSSSSWLRITAATDKASAECMVRLRPGASDGYRAGEDSRLLVDSEVTPALAVFTEADGRALDIQQVSGRREIPLGFSLREPAEVILTIQAEAGTREGWTLADRQTGRSWALDGGAVQVDLGELATHAGRFFLVKE